MQYRVDIYIAVYAPHHHRELVLARLQKPQCCQSAAGTPRQLAAVSAQPALGDFA
jgi:hypothetical protein